MTKDQLKALIIANLTQSSSSDRITGIELREVVNNMVDSFALDVPTPTTPTITTETDLLHTVTIDTYPVVLPNGSIPTLLGANNFSLEVVELVTSASPSPSLPLKVTQVAFVTTGSTKGTYQRIVTYDGSTYVATTFEKATSDTSNYITKTGNDTKTGILLTSNYGRKITTVAELNASLQKNTTASFEYLDCQIVESGDQRGGNLYATFGGSYNGSYTIYNYFTAYKTVGKTDPGVISGYSLTTILKAYSTSLGKWVIKEYFPSTGTWTNWTNEFSTTNDYEAVALSDNGASATDIAVGVKLTQTILYAETTLDVAASLATAATGSSFKIDIKKNGTSIFSTLLSIDASETTSITAATPYVFTSSPITWAVGDIREFSVTQVGSITAGKGLIVYLKKS